MSEKIRILFYALWIAQPVIQAAIAIVMFRRGQHREFKYFFAYIVALILTFTVIFPTYWYSQGAYFYVSWIATAISVALGFQVIHEAFLDVFRPFHTLRDLGTVLFKWAGLVMLLVAGVVSVSTRSSRSLLNVGSPPVNVTTIGLKNLAAAAKEFISLALADASVFQ